jgi:hypothetical protein
VKPLGVHRLLRADTISLDERDDLPEARVALNYNAVLGRRSAVGGQPADSADCNALQPLQGSGVGKLQESAAPRREGI